MQTIPAADNLTAAVKKTLHSAAFAKFMEQAVHAAVADLQGQPGTVVLPSAPTSRLKWTDGADFVFYNCTSADYHTNVHMQCGRTPDRSDMRNVWYGTESRTDADGNTWMRSIKHMVQDDFGFLVEVAA